MSKLMKNLLKQKAEHSKKIQDKFQGASFLYMGDPSLHWGMGGWVRGKANLAYGPKGCLDGGTHISYTVVSPEGKSQNNKGGTIRDLYLRFNSLNQGRGNYQRPQTVNSSILITSVDDEGRLIQNRITAVIDSGVKECFELVTAKGFSIIATADHKFLSGGKYMPLGDLSEGDGLRVFDNKDRGKPEKAYRADYKEWFVNHHPSRHLKHIKDRITGRVYTYCRLPEHRAVIEAHRNGMTVEAYRNALNTWDAEQLNGLWTIPEGCVVHHIDENKRNNDLSNLELMSSKEHDLLHHNSRPGSQKRYTREDFIVSIKPVGPRHTYDIKCEDPFNNFLANGIVTHNSGKSSLCAKGAGSEQQKTGGWVLVFDSEYAWQDPNEMDGDGELTQSAQDARARYSMAGLDYEKMLIISSNQPDTLFGSLGEIEKELKSGELNVSAMIVDSWAGIQGESAGKKIAEGEVAAAGNAFGGNAKMMGPILQTLLRVSAENGITSFFVQHCIQNMEQYGPRWKLLGGERLKYLVHSVLFVESIEARDAGLFDGDQTNEKGEGIRVGKRIRFRCEKSRRVVEGRSGEFYMNFKELRFARPEESLFNLAVNLGVIAHPRTYLMEDDGVTPKIDKKTGQPLFKENLQWWCFPATAESPMKFHGEAKTVEAIRTDKDLYQQIWEACQNTDSLSGLRAGDSISEVGD